LIPRIVSTGIIFAFKWDIFIIEPPVPIKPSDNDSPNQNLDDSLMCKSKLDLPRQAISEFLTHRNCENYKC
jgi:hypothetical protein